MLQLALNFKKSVCAVAAYDISIKYLSCVHECTRD